jgi:hypothetical protein
VSHRFVFALGKNGYSPPLTDQLQDAVFLEIRTGSQFGTLKVRELLTRKLMASLLVHASLPFECRQSSTTFDPSESPLLDPPK